MVKFNYIKVVLFFIAYTNVAHSTQLVYEPISPTFGGNPLNGNFLLLKAQSENDHADDFELDTGTDLDRFQESLQRNILNQISREITEIAFGESDLDGGGTFQTGDYTIEIITTNPDFVSVRITNVLNGETTLIEVPIFQ